MTTGDDRPLSPDLIEALAVSLSRAIVASIVREATEDDGHAAREAADTSPPTDEKQQRPHGG